jgi:DeoR/GlpR family transcriptional regulator of sugar metabolism
MLARQRQERILDEVQRHGGARVSDLVTTLGVSDMTIRRDIQELARRELVLRVHGGATSISGRSADEPGFVAKSALHPVPKSAIAVAAAALVEPGASIALSAGTTTYGLAQQLLTVPGLTIVTNSPPAANLLHEAGRDDLTVILTGGVRTPSNALVGPIALGALRTLHVDMLFLGVHGMDERAGLTTPNLVEAETDRAMVAAARRLVVVADHSKWGVVGLSTIADLGQVDILVTDDGIDERAEQLLSQRVRRLIVASPTDLEAAR